jgi:hypothetical protein
MPTKSKTPVVSFGPQLMAVLLKGSRERVELDFSAEPSRAVAMAFRLNQLRQAMRAENHEHSKLVYRAKVLAVRDENGKPTGQLIVSPKDAEFESALAAAGVELPATPVLDPSVEDLMPEEAGKKLRKKDKEGSPLPWDLGKDW